MRDERTSTGASTPLPADAEQADRSLGALREQGRELHRRRLLMIGGAAGLLVSAAFRIGVRLGAADILIRPGAWLDLALAALALAGAAWAIAGAQRADAHLARLEQEISAMRLLRDALAHELGTGLLVVRGEEASEPATRPARMGILSSAVAIAAVGMVVVAAVDASTRQLDGAQHRWTFLEQVTDPGALGFRSVASGAGEWMVADHAEATGARALFNAAGSPGEPPAITVVDRLAARDLRAMTRCKVSPGREEQACGLVFRYRDRGYYVAHVDAVQGAVRLSAVVDGIERPLEIAPAKLGPSVWQELAVQARGAHITVEWNGRKVIDVRDTAHPSPGAVGLWVPAEGEAFFDELAVHAALAR